MAEEGEGLKERLLEAMSAKKADILRRLSDFAVANIQKESKGRLDPEKLEGVDSVQVVVPFPLLNPLLPRQVEAETHAFQKTYNILQDKGSVEQILSKEQS